MNAESSVDSPGWIYATGSGRYRGCVVSHGSQIPCLSGRPATFRKQNGLQTMKPPQFRAGMSAEYSRRIELGRVPRSVNSLQFDSCDKAPARCWWLTKSIEVATAGVAPRDREQELTRENWMSDTKVSGIVHLIEETKTYGNKGFQKRLVVLEQDKGSFTNYVPIEFTRDSCDSVDQMTLGDEVEVTYRLNGRRWQKDEASEVKYFLSAEAMSFRIVSGGGDTMTEKVTEPNNAFAEAEDDEAPF